MCCFIFSKTKNFTFLKYGLYFKIYKNALITKMNEQEVNKYPSKMKIISDGPA